MGGLFGGGASPPAVPPPPPAANPTTVANPQTQELGAAARMRAADAAGSGFDSTLLSGVGASAAGKPATAEKTALGE